MQRNSLNIFAGRNRRTVLAPIPTSVSNDNTQGLPTTAGRTTSPESVGLYTALRQAAGDIVPDFEIELLKVTSYLAKHNGDISYAVDNIVQLGNTPAVISFDSGVSKEDTKAMIAYVTEAEKHIYRGGMNSLQNDLFAQVAHAGVISAELIPNNVLTGVDVAVIVNPYFIRFKYNPLTYRNEPYQKISGISNPSSPGMKKLNEATYKYYPLRTFDGSPYGIPPFIAALESLEIERDMIKNMRHIIKKLGMFGFLSVLVNAPARQQGEKDPAYQVRAAQYLETIRPTIEKGFSSGTVVGFKGAHEFKVEANNTNVSGATEILDVIMQMKAAGIKQDPLMLGRNFNVAETMAKVIMAKLTTQIGNTQRLVATVRADIYYMMLLMAGFKLKSVAVEYAPPMIGDKLRDEQAYAAKIANRKELRDTGMISQTTMANELELEGPFAEKNVDYTVPQAQELAKKALPSTTNPKNTAATEGTTNYSEVFDYMGGKLPEYVYKAANCNHGTIKYAKNDLDPIDGFVDDYQAAIEVEYAAAIAEVTAQVGIALAEFTEGATLEAITDRVMYILFTTWVTTFRQTTKPVVDEYVSKIYDYFRRDTSPFSSNFNPPTVHFNLHDIRTLEYFKDSDELYLGKFITDSDTRRKVTDFIKSKYLTGNEPIGKNAQGIKEFQAEFAELMHLQSWKIRRIIETTTNTMRNYGALSYIKQAEIVKFEIVGISDQLQCNYCAFMDGKQFDVDKAFDRVDGIVQSFPSFVKSNKPFITSLYGGKAGFDQLIELNEEEIQASGIDAPSFHPFCRCAIIAVM